MKLQTVKGVIMSLHDFKDIEEDFLSALSHASTSKVTLRV